MELLAGYGVPPWGALTLVLLSLLYWYGTSTFNTFKKLGIPYRPVYIPFLGHYYDLLTKTWTDIDAKLAKQFPNKVYGTFQGRQPILQTSDAEFSKEVLIKKFSSFMNRQVKVDEDSMIGNNMALIRDDHWKHIRVTLSPTFSSGKLKQMYPVICQCADKFVRRLELTDAKPTVINHLAAGYTMDAIARIAFGLDTNIQEDPDHLFLVYSKTFFGFPLNNRITTKIKFYIRIACLLLCSRKMKEFLNRFFDVYFPGSEITDYFYGLMTSVLSETTEELQKRKDFISMCSDKMVDLDKVDKDSIKVTDGKRWTTQGLTKGDIIANATIFLAAGYESVSGALNYFFYIMSLKPDIQDKLYSLITEVADENGECSYEDLKKLEYLDWCIDETMRMFPAVSRLDRVASSDVVVKGVTIPKGMVVEILVHSMHHDPDYWVEPETFNPDRFAPENKTEIQQYAFAPFGLGGRKCIATSLALLEVKVAIIKAMVAFRFEKCNDTPELEEVKFQPGMILLKTTVPLNISAVPRK
ncbi:CYP3A4 [Bugula neritina]|uniref:CYP3A4 n=1 Tax=Bugula neritina TaxID=10212 RepID=A0A7J7JUM0_BUGNE|nr:CYP3A4 [Bugula neritina]